MSSIALRRAWTSPGVADVPSGMWSRSCSCSTSSLSSLSSSTLPPPPLPPRDVVVILPRVVVVVVVLVLAHKGRGNEIVLSAAR